MPTLLDKWKLMLAIVSDPGLTGADNAVAAHLLDLCNDRGEAWPSIETLANRTGQSGRNVIRCIDRLVIAEYFIANRKRGPRGEGKTSTYKPQFDRASKVTAPSQIDGAANVTEPSLSEPLNVTAPSAKCDSAVNLNVTAPSPNPSYRSRLETPKEERELALDPPVDLDPIEDRFNDLWQQYPKQRRADRAKVLAKYKALIKAKVVTHDELLAAVMRYAASRDVVEGFACAPLRWLREERWKLDYQPYETPTNGAARANSQGRTLADAAADLITNTDRAEQARRIARMEF